MARLTGNKERSVGGRLQDKKGCGTEAPTMPLKAVKAAAAATAAIVLCVPEAQSRASKSTNLSLVT